MNESDVFKFGHLVDNDDVPYQYPNVWAVEKTTGPDRLKIAPTGKQVDLLLALTEPLREPFAVLYLLLIPRSDRETAGRYQSPLLSREEMQEFMRDFRDLFEQDGRHHVWVTSLYDDYSPFATLVYDQHNVIYAYGPLDVFQRILMRQGLSQAEEAPFPVPHSHHYNPQSDADVERLLNYWEWQQTPLHEDDEG